MVAIFRSTIIDQPIDAVWRVLRDFNSHYLWHPEVAESEIEAGLPADQTGDVRGSAPCARAPPRVGGRPTPPLLGVALDLPHAARPRGRALVAGRNQHL